MDNLEEIFDNIIKEAEDGITYKDITIKFHTLEKYSLNSSYNDGIPILVIKNKKELLNKLKQYILLVVDAKKINISKSNIKKCITLLFANACFEDFSNPTKFVDNHINFYLNNEFLNDDKVVDNIVIKRITQTIYNETPYAFKAYLVNNDKKYYLTNISYGISNDICYIYKMEKVLNDKDTDLEKNIDLKIDTDDIALSIFLRELYLYGISKVKVVSCLPLKSNKEEQIKQNNLLDRFIKLNYVSNNLTVTSNPFELDEYMNIELDEFTEYYSTIN